MVAYADPSCVTRRQHNNRPCASATPRNQFTLCSQMAREYNASRFIAAISGSNFLCISSRARPPKAVAACGFDRNSMIASAHSLGSSGSTNFPVSPSLTISANPSIRDATTGLPAAIASVTTKPKLSQRDGTTHTLARVRAATISRSVFHPSKRTASVTPESWARARSRVRMPLSFPTKMNWASGTRLRTSEAAFTMTSGFLRASSRPTKSTFGGASPAGLGGVEATPIGWGIISTRFASTRGG